MAYDLHFTTLRMPLSCTCIVSRGGAAVLPRAQQLSERPIWKQTVRWMTHQQPDAVVRTRRLARGHQRGEGLAWRAQRQASAEETMATSSRWWSSCRGGTAQSFYHSCISRFVSTSPFFFPNASHSYTAVSSACFSLALSLCFCLLACTATYAAWWVSAYASTINVAMCMGEFFFWGGGYFPRMNYKFPV